MTVEVEFEELAIEKAVGLGPVPKYDSKELDRRRGITAAGAGGSGMWSELGPGWP